MTSPLLNDKQGQPTAATLPTGMNRYETLIETQLKLTALTGSDLEAVMEVVVTSALRIVPNAEGAVVELLDGEEVFYFATAGTATRYKDMRLPVKSSLSGLCITENRAISCPDTAENDQVDKAAVQRTGIRSMILVPVPRHGRNIGALKLYSSVSTAFSEEDLLLTRLLIGAIATGISHVGGSGSVGGAEGK